MKERVQKLMAQANIGSRRACEEIISQGRVSVNGAVIHLGDKADPSSDRIEVDGQALNLDLQDKIYIALHKPNNVLSSNRPHKHDRRKIVRDLVPVQGHLFTIGRLDANSTGLIVLTNDGDLTNRLSHPRYQHTKTYRAIVYGTPTASALARWENGIQLDEGKTARCIVRVVKSGEGLATLSIIMAEGKKRQIRRIATMLGYPVRHLIRTHIGLLELGGLKPGEWRELTAKDIDALSTPSPEFKLLKQNQSAQHTQKRRHRNSKKSAAPRSKKRRSS